MELTKRLKNLTNPIFKDKKTNRRNQKRYKLKEDYSKNNKNVICMDYVLAYKICKDAIGDTQLIPDLPDKEILMLVSRENWLMFKIAGELDKNEAKIIARPNIYLRIEGDKFYLGLTLNQIKAIEWFIEIVQNYNKQKKLELIEMLRQLPDGYETVLNKKIKDTFWAQIPKYTYAYSFQSNTTNENKLTELCNKAEQIRKEGKQKSDQQKSDLKKYYSEFPEINLAKIELALTEENLKNTAKQLFPLLAKCLSIEQRIKIPENIQIIINKIFEAPKWWFYIKTDNDILLKKLNPKPNNEEFEAALKIIKNSNEFKSKYTEYFHV